MQDQRLADDPADGVLGEIVDGRAQAARRDGSVGALEHAAQHRFESLRIVADRVLRVHVDTMIRQRRRDMRPVGIDQLTEQNLGPNRHDLSGCHEASSSSNHAG